MSSLSGEYIEDSLKRKCRIIDTTFLHMSAGKTQILVLYMSCMRHIRPNLDEHVIFEVLETMEGAGGPCGKKICMHKRDIMACDFLMWFLVGKNCDWIIPVVSVRFSTENFCSSGLNLIIGASHDEGCNYGGRSSCWLPLRKDRPRMLNHAWHEESKLPYPTKAENDKAWRLANHTASPAAAASTTSAKTFEGFWEQMPTKPESVRAKSLAEPCTFPPSLEISTAGLASSRQSIPEDAPSTVTS